MAYFHTTVLDNQIKALPTVDTASGSVASFDTDLTENLIEVVCDIQYSQESGTPTPTNPLPITVYNSLNLAHIGNTDKITYLQGIINGTYGLVNLGNIIWTKVLDKFRASKAQLGTKSGQQYVPYNLICSEYPVVAYGYTDSQDKVCDVDSAGNFRIKDTSFTGDATEFRTAMNGVYLIYELETPTTTPTYTASDFNAMLADFGIDGSLHNIPFGQTVAKGTLNVLSGVLEITHGAITDLSSLNWLYSSGAQTFNVIVPNLATGQPCVSSVYDYSPVSIGPTRPDLTIGTSSYFGNNRLNIKDTNYDGSTINDFKASLSGQTCVYELETLTTIQLSAKQITALLNENNIWCDTGDTEVKYLLTVGKKIA